jgi:hypothetical protein
LRTRAPVVFCRWICFTVLPRSVGEPGTQAWSGPWGGVALRRLPSDVDVDARRELPGDLPLRQPSPSHLKTPDPPSLPRRMRVHGFFRDVAPLR